MIVDTSALLAFFDRDEPDHRAVAAVLENAAEPLVVSPYVVAELDYLVVTRLGVDAEMATLRELAGGAWDLDAIGADDLAEMLPVIEKYRGQEIGVADASRRRSRASPFHNHDRYARPPPFRRSAPSRRGPLHDRAVAPRTARSQSVTIRSPSR